MRVGICIAVLSLALAACVGPVAPDASGEEIYLQLCSNCHARDLEGGIGPALGPGSETASQPDEFLVVSLVQGRGRMPSFASTLDDQQLDRLIGFIREAQAD